MKCNINNELIISYVFGELENNKSEELAIHINDCPSCKQSYEQTKESYKLIQKLRATEKLPTDKELALNQIAEQLSENQEHTFFSSNMDTRKKARITKYQVVKLILNAAAIFLLGLFLYQQIDMKIKIESLNQNLQNAEPKVVNRKLPVNLEQFQKNSNLPLEMLIQDYDKLLRQNQEVLDYLEQNYPAIYEELIENDKSTAEENFKNI